jgi:hypothetical protein
MKDPLFEEIIEESDLDEEERAIIWRIIKFSDAATRENLAVLFESDRSWLRKLVANYNAKLRALQTGDEVAWDGIISEEVDFLNEDMIFVDS